MDTVPRASGTYSVGRNPVGVEVERWAAEAAIKNAVQEKHEARTDLHERALLLLVLHDL
jgi:hypothetical protein